MTAFTAVYFTRGNVLLMSARKRAMYQEIGQQVRSGMMMLPRSTLILAISVSLTVEHVEHLYMAWKMNSLVIYDTVFTQQILISCHDFGRKQRTNYPLPLLTTSSHHKCPICHFFAPPKLVGLSCVHECPDMWCICLSGIQRNDF